MNRKVLFSLIFALFAGVAFAAQGGPVYVDVAPKITEGASCATGPNSGRVRVENDTGKLWCCVASAWTACGSGGGGSDVPALTVHGTGPDHTVSVLADDNWSKYIQLQLDSRVSIYTGGEDEAGAWSADMFFERSGVTVAKPLRAPSFEVALTGTTAIAIGEYHRIGENITGGGYLDILSTDDHPIVNIGDQAGTRGITLQSDSNHQWIQFYGGGKSAELSMNNASGTVSLNAPLVIGNSGTSPVSIGADSYGLAIGSGTPDADSLLWLRAVGTGANNMLRVEDLNGTQLFRLSVDTASSTALRVFNPPDGDRVFLDLRATNSGAAATYAGIQFSYIKDAIGRFAEVVADGMFDSGLRVVAPDTDAAKIISFHRNSGDAPAAYVGADGSFVSSTDSGSNAFAVNTNGARIDFGAGADDYASSDGTTITFAGPVAIGGGTSIAKSIRATSTTDIASVSANACSDTTIAVTGATVGAECSVGMPTAPTNGLTWGCYISAADTVQLRICNVTTGPVDPPSATYSVRVWNP